jgi:hypothetical protein
MIFNSEDFGYWKNQTHNYLLSQSCAIWEIVQEAYVTLAMLENATQCELTRYKNNYKALNLITTALGRNVYNRVSHLENAYDARKDTYNRKYQTFTQKPDESLDD